MDSVERLCENIALINKSQVVLTGSIKDIRKQFSNNKLTVTLSNCSSPLKNDFIGANLLNIKNENNIIQAEFSLNSNTTPNDLLTYLTTKGTIHKFEEQLPTMNDIFLKVVENNK